MSLELDPRQRAMLQEMGVTVWLPAPPKPAAPAPAPVAAVPAPAPAPAQGSPAAAMPVAPRPPAAAAPPAARPAAAPATAPARAGQAPALQLHAPVLLYPQGADAPPQSSGGGWLVVVEGRDPAQPLAGDAGRLLDNMLRALGLHRNPRCHAAVLTRAAQGDGAAPQATLEQVAADLRPDMVLALGLGAARHVLASHEPLGRLRAQPHRLADGTPVAVSHDPGYLLRTPQAKAATWVDLCRALALVRAQA